MHFSGKKIESLVQEKLDEEKNFYRNVNNRIKALT